MSSTARTGSNVRVASCGLDRKCSIKMRLPSSMAPHQRTLVGAVHSAALSGRPSPECENQPTTTRISAPVKATLRQNSPLMRSGWSCLLATHRSFSRAIPDAAMDHYFGGVAHPSTCPLPLFGSQRIDSVAIETLHPAWSPAAGGRARMRCASQWEQLGRWAWPCGCFVALIKNGVFGLPRK